jgi:hypothetical protein
MQSAMSQRKCLAVMQSSPYIAYAERQGASSESEASVLAAIYAFILHKHSDRYGTTRPVVPDDGTKVKEDSANEHRST